MIYFIQSGDGGTIKIGFTNRSAVDRLADLQTGNPNTLRLLGELTGTAADELELHYHFAEYRIRGEWFSPVEQLLSFIGAGTPLELEEEDDPPPAAVAPPRETLWPPGFVPVDNFAVEALKALDRVLSWVLFTNRVREVFDKTELVLVGRLGLSRTALNDLRDDLFAITARHWFLDDRGIRVSDTEAHAIRRTAMLASDSLRDLRDEVHVLAA